MKQLKEKYAFTPDAKWLDHMRLSVVRFPGATGSFVSKDGLVMTNHHVGRSWTQRISDKDHDYVKHGFVALSREQEIKIPGLELNTLMATENVTDRVNAAAKPGMSDAKAMEARQQELERIKDELQKKTGLTCEEVALYQGGEHWIYSYKKHTDVRLVMAPELVLGAFGGDPDNFTYPRHGLDMTFFRVYENDKPYTPPHFLAFAKTGLKTGDLTFVSGHPGGTDRALTYAQMRFARDTQLPAVLRRMEHLKIMYQDYAKRSPEHARQVNDRIFGIENEYGVTCT
ncbi:MAG: S46 family peptidase, partial [Holophaga sp.]|nr:S46 family peptidase [Holophaga sp.]